MNIGSVLLALLIVLNNPVIALSSTTTLMENSQRSDVSMKHDHFKPDSFVSDVLTHPAFDGFGRYIFPIKNRSSYDRNMRIGNIGSLLPFHQEIRAETTLQVLNHLIDEVNSGRTIFYDIYTEQEKRNDPAKEDTGLFFFRGNPGAPFAIVCTGGGFSYVGSIHESYPLAIELSKRGYNAFAIEYRTGGANVACEDLAAAISFVFENAESLGVSTENYSLWGGSAGARMAAYLGSYGSAAYGGGDHPRPAAVIMQYTGHSDYTRNDPPTFAVIGENDGIASWRTMEQRVNALKAAGIDAEFHKYPNLGHGFGLGIGTTAEGWLDKAVAFWEKHLD
jgi:acetyl esterase/lipase